MRLRPRFIRPCLVATTLAPFSLPALADDTSSHDSSHPNYVGAPFRAYHAGAGHTQVPYPPPATRRPLDGSLRTSTRPSWLPNWGSGRRRQYSGPADPPEPATNWSGSYIGATIGGLSSTADLNGLTGAIDSESYSISGHTGSNYQIGSIVFGPELSAMATDAASQERSMGFITTKTELDWIASARVRAGIALDNVLLYGTGGVALTSSDVEISAPGFSVDSQNFHTGYVVGGGAEVELVTGIHARVEALHYGFSGELLPTPTGASELDLDVTTVRAGISLKFK